MCFLSHSELLILGLKHLDTQKSNIYYIYTYQECVQMTRGFSNMRKKRHTSVNAPLCSGGGQIDT